MVYLQFPGTREKLQGGVLEIFAPILGQLSVNVSDDFSAQNASKVTNVGIFPCGPLLLTIPCVILRVPRRWPGACLRGIGGQIYRAIPRESWNPSDSRLGDEI